MDSPAEEGHMEDGNATLGADSSAKWSEQQEPVLLILVTVIILVLLFILGVAANVVLLLAFNRRSALQSISNRFVGNLLAVNLISTTVLIPLTLLDLLSYPEVKEDEVVLMMNLKCGVAFCFVRNLLSWWVASASLLSTLLIACDQYLAILFPLSYNQNVTSSRSWLMIALTWLAAAIISFVLTVSHFNGWWPGCPNGWITRHSGPLQPLLTLSFWSMSTFCMMFALPFLLLTFIYGRIYLEAHKSCMRIQVDKINPVQQMLNTAFKITDRMGQPIVKPQPEPDIQICPGTLFESNDTTPKSSKTLQRSKTSSFLYHSREYSGGSRRCLIRSQSQQLMLSIRNKWNIASIFMQKRRRQVRLARVSLIIVVLVLVCWSPYFILILLMPHHLLDPEHKLWAQCGVRICIEMYPVLSPCVFAFRCKRLQREVSQMFSIHRHKNGPKMSPLPTKTLLNSSSIKGPRLIPDRFASRMDSRTNDG